MNPTGMIMRASILACGICLACAASGQDIRSSKSLFNDDSELTGGFISFTPRFTNVLGSYAVLSGFSAGVTVNERLNVGLAGAFSGTAIKNARYKEYLLSRTTAVLDGLELRYGYVGLLVEPVLRHRSVVHLNVPIIVGMGWMAYSYPASSTNSNNTDKSRIRTDGQGYLVVEPGLEIEVNILRSLRFGAGGSYIYTSDLEQPNTPPDALRNFTARFTLKYQFQRSEEYRRRMY